MEETEEMVALKKAYADIILNQSKEAATRIMVAERKALGFHQELLALKDESLSMLVRLKQIMDSKVNEAQTETLTQGYKIKELESQLKEARDFAEKLKEELKETHIELEKVKYNSVKTMKVQTEKGTSTSELPLVDSRLGPTSPENSDRLLRDSPENCNDNTELRSVIIRSRSPDLYKDGCERNLINGNLSRREEEDRDFAGIQSEQIVKEDEGTCTIAATKYETTGSTKMIPTKAEVPSKYKKNQAFNVLRRSSRKRSSTYKCSEYREPSSTSHCKTGPSVIKKVVESREGFQEAIEEGAEKKSNSHLISVSSLNSIRLCESALSRTGESSMFPNSVNLDEGCSLPMGADYKQHKECEVTNMDEDKPLKYTFKRKRKREESMGSPEKYEPVEQKNTSKRSSGEKQSSDPEPQKSNSIVGSSRDSRRLAQVARQLLSLSEKKW